MATSPSQRRTWLVYALMLAVTVGVFLIIRARGVQLAAPAAALGDELFGQPGKDKGGNALGHVLLALGVVIVVARGLAYVFKRLHQPPVIGEVIAGLLLGPSLLGRVAPDAYGYLLPPTVAPYLGVLSQVGVILYMFLVGLELDLARLRTSSHATIAISHASIVVPFLLGSGLALWLYPQVSSSDVPFTVFALFMGVSMSVTAFPVLARILTDRQMHRTRLGTIALSCAAVDDVTAWCLLAFVVSVAHTRVGGAALTTVLAMGYIAFMLLAVRPAIAKLVHSGRLPTELSQGLMAGIFVLVIASAFFTEMIGIHAIFGGFVIGAIIPSDSKIARDLVHKLEDLVIVLLLPAFFAFTGMRTQIGLVQGADQWVLCGAIILVASLGKFGGTLAAARATGLGWRESSMLGILMNTRGLMELIVLNVGLDLKVISPQLFAMLVVMAVVTTIATTPILHLLQRGAPQESGPVHIPS